MLEGFYPIAGSFPSFSCALIASLVSAIEPRERFSILKLNNQEVQR
jgi:hypothetical protein